MTMRAITADIVPWSTRSLRVRQRAIGHFLFLTPLRIITESRPKTNNGWLASQNDDVGSSAGNYSLDLGLLGLGRSELVKCLLQIVEKGFPLCRR